MKIDRQIILKLVCFSRKMNRLLYKITIFFLHFVIAGIGVTGNRPLVIDRIERSEKLLCTGALNFIQGAGYKTLLSAVYNQPSCKAYPWYGILILKFNTEIEVTSNGLRIRIANSYQTTQIFLVTSLRRYDPFFHNFFMLYTRLRTTMYNFFKSNLRRPKS